MTGFRIRDNETNITRQERAQMRQSELTADDVIDQLENIL